MCELLGMSAYHPASITLSLNEFARHGGETGPHVDGWGVAFYEGRDANLIRESSAAARSFGGTNALLSFTTASAEAVTPENLAKESVTNNNHSHLSLTGLPLCE